MICIESKDKDPHNSVFCFRRVEGLISHCEINKSKYFAADCLRREKLLDENVNRCVNYDFL